MDTMSWDFVYREGSVWFRRKIIESGSRIEFLYGYTDSRGSHGHAVFVSGDCEYKRDIVGLNPIFSGDKIFL